MDTEFNEEALEWVPAEAVVTPFKGYWKMSCVLLLLTHLYPGTMPLIYYLLW